VTDGRIRILRATLEIIGSDGIGGLSNRRVAKQAGISLGSLTYHFSSQSDLLRESLLLFVAQETERINELATRLESTVTDPAAAVAAVQTVLGEIAFGREEIASFELYVQAGRDSSLHEAAQRCFAAYDGIAATALGKLGVPDPERTARAAVALIAGSQLRRLATGVTDTSAVGEALSLLLAGAFSAG
jgi:DNA-binding transcriptional regulator YbjK